MQILVTIVVDLLEEVCALHQFDVINRCENLLRNIDDTVGSTNFTLSESQVTLCDPTESLRVYYDKNTFSGHTVLVILSYLIYIYIKQDIGLW